MIFPKPVPTDSCLLFFKSMVNKNNAALYTFDHTPNETVEPNKEHILLVNKPPRTTNL
jgi:hypothetical protein